MNRSLLWAGGVALLIVLALLFVRGKPARESAQTTSVTSSDRGATPAVPTPPPPAPKTAIPLPPAQHSDGEGVVHGKWGSAPGQFGRRRDPESSPEGPMAVAAGARGEL